MNSATLLKVVLLVIEVIRSAVTWHNKEERNERIRRIKDDPVAEWNRRVAGVSAMDDWPVHEPELSADYPDTAACFRAGRLDDACRPGKAAALFRESGGVPPVKVVPSDEDAERIMEVAYAAPLRPPARQTSGAAGYDLPSAVEVTIWPGQQVVIPTGWRIAIPPGYFGKIESRSGWALKNRISHRAGVIDEDYRGEVKVLLVNEGERPFDIKRGDRVAQMVIHKYEAPDILLMTEFTSTTDRGSGGFGSTGGKSNG